MPTRLPLIFLDDLLLRLDFRDPTPEIIDLSPVGGMVSTLQEGKIECLSGDKVRLVKLLSVFFFISDILNYFAPYPLGRVSILLFTSISWQIAGLLIVD